MIYPTGEQYEISAGGCTAVVTEVGATLRSLTMGGHDILHGFAVETSPTGGRGQQLLPWPNRVRDGRYVFGGVTQQLPLSEPARHNASHGLGRNVPWVLFHRHPDRVTLRLRIYTQPGWPGILEARITYAVGANGLTVDVTATSRHSSSRFPPMLMRLDGLGRVRRIDHH